jgi:hypothetical protein
MISWEQAISQIYASQKNKTHQDVSDTWLYGAAAVSWVLSAWGFHFDSPTVTDHNWSGIMSIGEGIGGVTPAECAKTGGSPQLGITYKGTKRCFVRYLDDDAGAADLIRLFLDNDSVNHAVSDGDVVPLASALWTGGGSTGMVSDWPQTYGDAVRLSFDSEEQLRNALILALQDLEQKTGLQSGWRVGQKPVSQIYLTNQGQDTPSGGSVVDNKTEESAGMGGWLLGGAIVAVAVGLFYATTKVR